MPYRIAGIDVHKQMLAVVVADIEVEGDFQFDRQKIGTSPADLRALADWLVEREVDEVVMESTAQYWRPVWEALELHGRPEAPDARGRESDLRDAPPCTSAVESRGRWPEERLSGCGASGEAPRGSGAHPELCARRRAATLADSDAPQIPDHPQPRAAAQPIGIAAGRSAYQAVQPRLRSAGHQRSTHVAGPRRWRDEPCHGGIARRPAPPRNSRSIVRRLERVHDIASRVSSAAEADAGRIAIDRGAPRPTRS